MDSYKLTTISSVRKKKLQQKLKKRNYNKKETKAGDVIRWKHGLVTTISSVCISTFYYYIHFLLL
jgi:hypothetical protein